MRVQTEPIQSLSNINMGIMIESIWLFSLAVLIIAVGLLVYYFKKRIAEVENKSSKSLEIVHDLYMQQMKMKSDFNAIIKSLQEDNEEEEEAPDNIQFTLLNHELKHTGVYEDAEEIYEHQVHEHRLQEHRLQEHQVQEYRVQEYRVQEHQVQEEEPLDIKTVNVDMSLPDEELIEITNDDEQLDESDDDDESEQPELLEEDRVVVEKIGSEQSQHQSVSKEDLKKMTPSTLKSLIISKGVSADAVHKMKKNELIDVLLKL